MITEIGRCDEAARASAPATWVLIPALCLVLLAGCTAPVQSPTLFDELGGHAGIERMVDEFILEIANDPRVLPRFVDSNVERFREKITEHFCMIAGGPCEYTGDSMVLVHAGMDITSPEFNAIVENLMSAMDDAAIPMAAQNQLLARLARLRPEIIRL